MLSIITPVYNVEAYLDRCVQSVLSQSYRNIEMVLIDDGSTDGSGALCDKWAQEDSRVVVIHKENGGVSSARNAGLVRSKGDFLTFVDPDDFISPETYTVNMTYLLKHQDVDILQYPYCNYFNEDDIRDYHKPAYASTIAVTRENDNEIGMSLRFLDEDVEVVNKSKKTEDETYKTKIERKRKEIS